MHDDQLAIDADLARELIYDQFPQWRREPVTAVRSDGTVNAIFRIGTQLAARFPLRAADPDETEAKLKAEADTMLELTANIPVPTPRPVAVGRPDRGYPLPWAVQTWIPGEVTTPTGLAHSTPFAHDLASLIRGLRGADTRGRLFAGTGRGGHLPDHSEWMDFCFDDPMAASAVAHGRNIGLVCTVTSTVAASSALCAPTPATRS